jgi:hypothetical protein
MAELKGHLRTCEECRRIYTQYAILAKEGIPLLAARYSEDRAQRNWDERATRRKLFARVQAAKDEASSGMLAREHTAQFRLAPLTRLCEVLAPVSVKQVVGAALAVLLFAAAGLVAYRLSTREHVHPTQARTSNEDRFQKLAAEKESVDELLTAERTKSSQLNNTILDREQELAGLRSKLQTLSTQLGDMRTANGTLEEQLRNVAEQRDTLTGRLREAERIHLTVQPELASLRTEREEALHQIALLQSKLDDFAGANRDYERRLTESERLLGYDRDIRDLMGARNLYIADVFDVDTRSRTRKPYGRVFYTRGKSLVFYAFDLDHQRGVNNASTFQVWGQNGLEEAAPVSLGILYMDSGSNHRWVVQCDNQEQLEKIERIFVTAEPPGGSRSPTGKAFLFALLRREANHP